jgi:hypothetical protein
MGDVNDILGVTKAAPTGAKPPDMKMTKKKKEKAPVKQGFKKKVCYSSSLASVRSAKLNLTVSLLFPVLPPRYASVTTTG